MSRGVGVTEAVRGAVPEWFELVARALALPGDIVIAALVVALVYVLGVRQQVLAGDDGRLCPERTIALIAVVFGGLSLAIALKAGFALPRPPAELQAIPRSGEGFPSGHTMTAAVLWGALALWSRRSTLARRLAGAGTLVTLVAFSRLALGVHFLVDVLASVVFATLYLLVMWSLVREDALRAFGVAFVLAVLAVGVSGGSTDSVLAIVGTVGGFVGWRLSEHAVVRTRVFPIAVAIERRLPGGPEGGTVERPQRTETGRP